MKNVKWVPAGLFGLGALFTVGIDVQRSMELRFPLGDAVGGTLEGYVSEDVVLSRGEVEVAGVSEYLMRQFQWTDSSRAVTEGVAPWYSVYVGYYDSQVQGKTIHSPKNCLPGAGWEALSSTQVAFTAGNESVVVNRYLIQNGEERAVVLYWYQGRGRVESNEYRVKWDLLVDAAMRRRTEEALVRIVIPVSTTGSPELAEEMGIRVAQIILPELNDVLPG